MPTVKDRPTAKRCPECGGELIIKQDRRIRGHFFGCENYSTDRKCEYTEPLPEGEISGMDEFNPPVRECITARQAEKYAGLSRSRIQALLASGQIKGFKIASTMWLTTRQAIDEYFQAKQHDWLNKHARLERGAKIRADWTCQRCGRQHGPGLQYITVYYKDGDKENQSPENMIVLCYECRFFAQKTYHPDQMVLPGMELPEWMR